MAGRIIKASTGLGVGTKSDDGKEHPHPQVEDMVNTVGFSLVQELMQYLKGPEGEQALEHILDCQSRVVAKLAPTPEARQAMRVAAAEVVAGSYDAAYRKWAEAFHGARTSGIQYFLAMAVLVYVSLLATGVLLTCWRFAFFSLH
jgi:hypothetical protein